MSDPGARVPTHDGRPLVTAIVTFYNQAEFVAGALDSILGQTYPALEVIAVDDGSTDETAHRCAAYGDRITYAHQKNAGAASARNAGLRLARGSLIANLDGDDLWEPEKLQVQVDAARRFPEAPLIAVDGVEFSAAGIWPHALIGPTAAPLFEGVTDSIVLAECYDRLLVGNFLATPSQVMLRTPVLRRVGGWDPRFTRGADYDLYLRLARTHPFVLVRQKLARWRYSPGGLSGDTFIRGFNWELERQKILRMHQDLAPVHCRPHIRQLRKEGMGRAARAAYHAAHQRRRRRWATAYLLRLMATGRHLSASVPYLAGVWCPTSLVNLVRRLRGRSAAANGSPMVPWSGSGGNGGDHESKRR